MGSIYGKQWRKWSVDDGGSSYIDQIRGVIETIKTKPLSRRHMVSAWNVGQIRDMALPPCHFAFQFYVRENKFLDCHMMMRSNDLFLGCPFNIASYSLLTHMIAQVTGYDAGELVYSIGDAHIYLNHIDQVKTLLSREPKELPELWLNDDIDDIDDFTLGDIKLKNYQSHPAIKAPLAV